jgi:hypothetical protein
MKPAGVDPKIGSVKTNGRLTMQHSRPRYASLIVLGVIALLLFGVIDPPRSEWRRRMSQRAGNVAKRYEQARVQEANDARRAAAEADRAERESLAARLAELRNSVAVKWRADVDAAHAHGEPGIVPPMLDVREERFSVEVINRLADRPVCVQLQRVSRRSTRANDYDRCRLDLETCRDIEPGALHRFQLFNTGNPAACMAAPLEFRVGTPMHPEPTWWSRSALEDFDAAPPTVATVASATEKRQLRGDIAELEALLSETGRAARWSRELVTE